jgi:uncharacterized membrane-anchored protein
MKIKRWKFRNVLFVVLAVSVALFTIAHLIHPNMHGWMPPIAELLGGSLVLAALIYGINQVLSR